MTSLRPPSSDVRLCSPRSTAGPARPSPLTREAWPALRPVMASLLLHCPSPGLRPPDPGLPTLGLELKHEDVITEATRPLSCHAVSRLGGIFTSGPRDKIHTDTKYLSSSRDVSTSLAKSPMTQIWNIETRKMKNLSTNSQSLIHYILHICDNIS